MKENIEIEKNFKDNIEKYNSFLDFYFLQLVVKKTSIINIKIYFIQTDILDSFEAQEQERLDSLNKAINNIFIYEISSLKEFLDDIDLASKVILFLRIYKLKQRMQFIESIYRFNPFKTANRKIYPEKSNRKGILCNNFNMNFYLEIHRKTKIPTL